jgi:hypothetical protein
MEIDHLPHSTNYLPIWPNTRCISCRLKEFHKCLERTSLILKMSTLSLRTETHNRGQNQKSGTERFWIRMWSLVLPLDTSGKSRTHSWERLVAPTVIKPQDGEASRDCDVITLRTVHPLAVCWHTFWFGLLNRCRPTSQFIGITVPQMLTYKKKCVAPATQVPTTAMLVQNRSGKAMFALVVWSSYQIP